MKLALEGVLIALLLGVSVFLVGIPLAKLFRVLFPKKADSLEEARVRLEEVIKATEITKAQQEKDVATLLATKNKEVAALALETAKLEAQTTMTNAKADSDARKLAMVADNALEKRLSAYVEVQKAWAAAAGAQRQTPDVVLGGGGGGNSTAQLMELWTARAARDLNVSTK